MAGNGQPEGSQHVNSKVEKNNQDANGTDSTLSPEVKNRLQNLLEEDFVSEENGEQVKEFIHELNSVRDDQISDFRLLKYLSQF